MPTKLTDMIRITLYGILIFLLVMAFQAWDKDHPKPISSTNEVAAVTNNYVPTLTTQSEPTTTGANQPTVQTAAPVNAKHIQVTTELYDVEIDPVGGNLIGLRLKHYPESLNTSNPFVLLTNSDQERYIAQSGLLNPTGPDTSKGQAIYTADQTHYVLNPNQNELQVKLNWKNANGITVTKIFTFHRENYEVDLNYQINNASQQPWTGNLYLQLMRKNTPPPTKGFIGSSTFFGAAVSSPDKPFEKISFKQMDKTNLDETIQGGWAAMIQHYFVSAWVPDHNWKSQYFTRVTPDGLYTVGLIGPAINVAPGQTIETKAKFYGGPSIQTNLKQVAPGLQLTIDYGWLWFIAEPIFLLMQWLFHFLGNWGWAIVFVTLIIKLIFYPLSAKSYRSMSGMKKIQPKLAALKERFGEDKQKLTKATLELYQKEKVNPVSGCLPILIQIPVFIALYWVLIESVQLRQAPFIFWIHDLSIKDPYYILPVLMGISMFLQQRLNPPPPDPTQAKVMMLMPVVFTILFVNFPAGLMLYWFVNNTLSFLQQWYIMHQLDKADKLKK